MNARVIKKKGNYYIAMEWYSYGERKTRSISVRQYLNLGRAAEAREAKAVLHKLMEEHRQGLFPCAIGNPFKRIFGLMAGDLCTTKR